MVSNIDEIKVPFFRYLAGELPLKEFEQWLYSTPEIEDHLGKPAYLELISFSFQQSAVDYELSKIIYKYINPAQYHNWQIKRLLRNLLDGAQDPVNVFEELYWHYCDGYRFLGDIGIQYVLGIEDIPRLTEQHLWDQNEFSRRRILLNNYVLPLKDDIEILLQALESSEIKILNEHEYFIEPELAQKLQTMREVSKRKNKIESARSKKKWWRSW